MAVDRATREGISDVSRLDRPRLGWWLYVLVLAGAVVFLAHSFIDILVLGVFGYYATRPICNRLNRVIESKRLAALLTVSVVLLPVFVSLFYAGLQIVQQLAGILGGSGAISTVTGRLAGTELIPVDERVRLLSVLNSPLSVGRNLEGSLVSSLGIGVKALTAVFSTLLLLTLSVTLSYALLERDDRLADGLVELFGGRDTTAYAYALAVDEDLESVFFGNLLFVVFMAVVATATYAVTNVVAPDGLRVPMVLVLGLLTGMASIIPVVVGKVVYLPVIGLLGIQASNSGLNRLPFVGGVLVVYGLVLDVLPQSFIQPYLSGQKFDTIILLFAYILGPIVFGWYGFFFLPIIAVLVFEAVRIVLPQLLHGETLGPAPLLAEDVGSRPRERQKEKLDAEETNTEDTTDGSSSNEGSPAPN